MDASDIGKGGPDLGDLRILLAGVPGVTDRGWLGYCTVVLFPLEDGWALFDTGHYSDRHLLLAALQKADVSPGDIRHVVLSHLHFDHSLNLPLFRNAQVYISRAELDYATNVLAGEAQDSAIPDFFPALLDKHRVHILKDGFRLSPTKRLMILPGHTPGSMVMLCEGPRKVAVCGDAVKNAWEAVNDRSHKAQLEGSVIVPGHDAPFILHTDSVEFLAPFRWEVKISLYPDRPNQTVASPYRPAGTVRA